VAANCSNSNRAETAARRQLHQQQTAAANGQCRQYWTKPAPAAATLSLSLLLQNPLSANPLNFLLLSLFLYFPSSNFIPEEKGRKNIFVTQINKLLSTIKPWLTNFNWKMGWTPTLRVYDHG